MTCLLAQRKFECRYISVSPKLYLKYVIWVNRVSSVLNKDNRSYGKRHMFDNCPDTCWNSDAGTPQWIIISFEEKCEVSSFEIQFQGGFVGKDCQIEAGDKGTEFLELFYPGDNNTVQKFNLREPKEAKDFKFVFSDSTDFFGRIIIYKLSLYS